jgi:hypothetical protein
MESSELAKNVQLVNGCPIPKDPLAFFNFKTEKRTLITITDQIQTWQDDLRVAEKMFTEIHICPSKDAENHAIAIEQVKTILKERMKYPGIKENPELEKIAKIWVPPARVHLGPPSSTFFQAREEIQSALDCSGIHVLKIQVGDGSERRLLYSILDAGYRPGMIIIKWSHDLDDHTPTAQCAGHMMNTGYHLVHLENGYALYIFFDQPLYDICSMKIPALSNPMLQTILTSVSEMQAGVPTKNNS